MKVIYTAKSYSGETKGGEADVKNERDLVNQLRSDGFILTSFKEIKSDDATSGKVRFIDRFKTVPLGERMIFTRNLGVMIASGLPLSRAVYGISLQTKNKRFAKILQSVHDDIQSGTSFAEGIAKYPAVFSELYINMVKVGETSGNLEEVLNILAVQLEKEHELISKVKGAMIYPAVIIIAMIGIGILMLTYILPKITSVFKDMDVTLPRSTQIVIGISDFLRFHSILSASIMISFFVGIQVFLKTDFGKKALSFIAINLPMIKNIIIKVNCARFARIYSSLLKSGVSVVESLKIVSRTLTNYYYRNALEEAIEQVQKGTNLSVIIATKTNIFPVLVNQMIQVGEETGKTETVLLKLAEFYEDEVSQITKNMSSIIEPVLMIVIGAAVGFFAVSMLQPMYSLMENIN